MRRLGLGLLFYFLLLVWGSFMPEYNRLVPNFHHTSETSNLDIVAKSIDGTLPHHSRDVLFRQVIIKEVKKG
jgi:hypothetical protein